MTYFASIKADESSCLGPKQRFPAILVIAEYKGPTQAVVAVRRVENPSNWIAVDVPLILGTASYKLVNIHSSVEQVSCENRPPERFRAEIS